MRLSICCLGLMLWCGAALRAQTADTAAAPPETGLTLSFARQNNFTYGARTGLQYPFGSDTLRGVLRLQHDQLLNTALSRAAFVQLFIQADLDLYYRLRPQLDLSARVETDQFWNARNHRHSIYGGLQWTPAEGIRIRPMLGYSWDYRSARLDQGVSPALQVQLARGLDGFGTLEFDMQARVKYIQPRRQHNLRLAGAWARQDGEALSIYVQALAGSNRMDDYKSESVEQIRSDTLSAEAGWTYRLAPGIAWESANRFSLFRRAFVYDPLSPGREEFNDLRYTQQELLLRQRVTAGLRRLRGSFLYEYLQVDRGYALANSLNLSERDYLRLVDREMQKDFIRRQYSLEAQATWRLPRHQLSLIGSNRYLQFDTPAETNVEDHDELNYSLSGEWRARWSGQFSTRYKLLGGVRRYAFLFAERSQDNYTLRSLRLEFDFRWTPVPRLTLRGEQALYVLYNVKDFADLNRTDRSTRNLESRLQAEWRMKRATEGSLSFYRREVQVAYLNWDAFSETPLDTTLTYLAEHSTRLPLSKPGRPRQLWIDLGYKHLSQLRYFNTSMTSLQFILTPINLHVRSHQSGPVTGLRLRWRNGSSAEASFWWQGQIQNYRYRLTERFQTLSASYREADLQETSQAFRPFIRLQCNVALGAQRAAPRR
ncbi:MAG: hypothetical protein NW241_19210 [Bacteroidia bacterium]|nr:hypothetical protein [Bacteroidia bacterium]